MRLLLLGNGDIGTVGRREEKQVALSIKWPRLSYG